MVSCIRIKEAKGPDPEKSGTESDYVAPTTIQEKAWLCEYGDT
jgi:hypothetical protein